MEKLIFHIIKSLKMKKYSYYYYNHIYYYKHQKCEKIFTNFEDYKIEIHKMFIF